MSPTQLPTIYISQSTNLQLLHVFSFNDNHGLTPANVSDSVGGRIATLHNGVEILNGKAVFHAMGAGSPIPYIQLPIDSLNSVNVTTIEIWVTVDPSNNPSATLFSFGSSLHQISFSTASLTADVSTEYYIVVVYNMEEHYSKVYIDGVLLQTETIYLPAFEDSFSFIGLNYSQHGRGMTASVDEFRIYYGELPLDYIQNNFWIGVDPSHIYLSKQDTLSNVNMTFMVASLQEVSIGFYGGASDFMAERRSFLCLGRNQYLL